MATNITDQINNLQAFANGVVALARECGLLERKRGRKPGPQGPRKARRRKATKQPTTEAQAA